MSGSTGSPASGGSMGSPVLDEIMAAAQGPPPSSSSLPPPSVTRVYTPLFNALRTRIQAVLSHDIASGITDDRLTNRLLSEAVCGALDQLAPQFRELGMSLNDSEIAALRGFDEFRGQAIDNALIRHRLAILPNQAFHNLERAASHNPWSSDAFNRYHSGWHYNLQNMPAGLLHPQQPGSRQRAAGAQARMARTMGMPETTYPLAGMPPAWPAYATASNPWAQLQYGYPSPPVHPMWAPPPMNSRDFDPTIIAQNAAAQRERSAKIAQKQYARADAPITDLSQALSESEAEVNALREQILRMQVRHSGADRTGLESLSAADVPPSVREADIARQGHGGSRYTRATSSAGAPAPVVILKRMQQQRNAASNRTSGTDNMRAYRDKIRNGTTPDV